MENLKDNKCLECGRNIFYKKIVSFFGIRNTILECPNCKSLYEVKNTGLSFALGFFLTVLSSSGISFFYLQKNYPLFFVSLLLAVGSILVWASLSKLVRKNGKCSAY